MGADRPFGNLFLCAGAMKAGTTWLYHMLRRHPELRFPLEKEPHYFYHILVDDSYLGDTRRLERARNLCIDAIERSRGNPDLAQYGLRRAANYVGGPVDDFWYRALFEPTRGDMYASDFSVLSALVPAEAWPRIEAKCRRLRVLYMLREPSRQLWSNVKYHMQTGGMLDRLLGGDPDEIRRFARIPHIRESSEYGAAIRKMKAGLSEGTLKVIFYEDMHDDRSSGLAGIEDFLGIRRNRYQPEVLELKANVGSGIPMPEWFPDLFAEDAARIRAEVEAEGLVLPKSWRL